MMTSFLKSLMHFNQRVLMQGTLDKTRKYTINDIDSLMFFNSVFISNCNECFEKYDIDISTSGTYAMLCGIYGKNITSILEYVNKYFKISFIDEDSFERRWSTINRIKPYLVTAYHDPKLGLLYPFKDDQLYYICKKHGQVAVTTIDPRTSVYETPFKDNSKPNSYWKTDRSIADAIKSKLKSDNMLIMRVTRSKKAPYPITKVEYCGDTALSEIIREMVGYKALVIRNEFIYIDDIRQAIKKAIPQPTPKYFQYENPIKFQELMKNDSLLEYPMDSFNTYLQFLSAAANSPNVQKISITLYRIGKDPAIYYILRDAINNGIAVHANIELCASGEKINKDWKREFENIGITVTTFAKGQLKVHSKLTLIEFKDGEYLAQIGTGNYHTNTTKQYTDLSLTTADRNICAQVSNIFKLFLGTIDSSEISFDENLAVTQFNLRDVLGKYIMQESAKKSDGLIIIKCNALDDDFIISKLAIAAKNGCKINLIVRSVCTWVPKEINENVIIKSFVWDKLEHSRVYSFGKENPTVYIGSLDPVTKKIDKRIEVLVRVNDSKLSIRICSYLNRYLTNNSENSWRMNRDGLFVRCTKEVEKNGSIQPQ